MDEVPRLLRLCVFRGEGCVMTDPCKIGPMGSIPGESAELDGVAGYGWPAGLLNGASSRGCAFKSPGTDTLSPSPKFMSVSGVK